MPLQYLLFPFLFIGAAVQTEAQHQQAATKVVTEQIRTLALKEAMLAALNRHPASDRWSGTDDRQIFGISVISFTDRDVRDGDVRLLRTTAGLIAAKEMLFARVLLDKYAATGLTDAGSLREAVALANETFSARGRIMYNMEETFIIGHRIVGITVADRSKVVAVMTEQARMDAVWSAYREVVHRQAHRLIADNKFEEALKRLLELRQAGLLGREQLFDVLHCFVGMERPVDAEKIVNSLRAGHTEDATSFRRLVAITTTGEHIAFQRLTQALLAEIDRLDRLDPPELTAEQVLEQLLNEFSGTSPAR